MVTCKANTQTDQPSAHRPTQHHTGTLNSDDEHFESDPHTDKFNSIVNFKASIIREGNLGVDGVQGRLKPSLHFWSETLQAPQFAYNVIERGYVLPFESIPSRAFLLNNKSALNHSDFVEQTIEKLLTLRCIDEHVSSPHVVNPLSVVDGKKLRLVLDLRHVYPHIRLTKFRYEDPRSLSEVFQQGFYIFTFDLESGYYHIDIFGPRHRFLGFSWKFGSISRYFTFKVLPFGLCSACYFFTKMLRPFVRRWRAMGHFSFVYIDDGISGASDIISVNAASRIERTESDLINSGFKGNESKSHWEPMQIGEWLGFVINTIRITFQVPQRKIEKLQALISTLVSSYLILIKDLARVAGQIISMTLGLGPIARLFTRQMYFRIESRLHWHELVSIDPALLEELRFWLQHLPSFIGYAISRSLSATSIVYSDASDTGYGGYTVQVGDRHKAVGLWSEVDSKLSSTYREMKAILNVLQSFKSLLHDQAVVWFTDSENSVRIVQFGSSKPHLQSIAVEIFSICLSSHVDLRVEWLPRTKNEQADYLSRLVDPDDWALGPTYFSILDQIWGPHTIDRFASDYNTHATRFNSCYWNPGPEAVDAFTRLVFRQ